LKELRIVFMGTPQFAIPSLEKIYHSHHKLVAIVTQPDRPKGRGKKVSPPPVKEFAIQDNINPVFQPISLKDPKFIATLQKLNADIFVVVAFRILPEEIFQIPPRGTINLHPSLLPKYRGAAPINWTIINGEQITGVTTIFIKNEIDAGNVILQKPVEIMPDETAGSLHDRLAETGADSLLESLNLIASGEVEVKKQDDAVASKAPKLTKEICHINFNRPAEQVRNWIHGLSPFPGGYAFLNNKILKFFRATVIPSENYNKVPGEIINITSDELWIACKSGAVSILELQLEGHMRMPIEDFLRGHPLRIAEILK